MTKDLTAALIEEHTRAKAGTDFSLIDGASYARDPIFPNRPFIGLLRLAAGASIGAVWVLLGRRWRVEPLAHHK